MLKRILFCLLGTQLLAGAAQAEDLGNVYTDRSGGQWIDPQTNLEFSWIEPGCFYMRDWKNKGESPRRKVCLKGFFMSRYEVTQAQYQQVMGRNPSMFQGASNPVETVSWNDAVGFTEKISNSTGDSYSLPSEAQWEWACQAGGAHWIFCAKGLKREDLGWHNNKSTSPIGDSGTNEWMLHDMSGNVAEWTLDCYKDNYEGAPIDGSAFNTENCGKRVVRGGAWNTPESTWHSTSRSASSPDSSSSGIGFRVVKNVQAY